MKKILLVFLMGIHIIALAQTEYKLPTNHRSHILDIREYNDGYVGLYVEDSLEYHYWNGVILFDDDFNYEIFEWKKDEMDIFLHELLITGDNNILLIGTIGKEDGIGNDGHTLYFLLIDESFNVLNETFLEMPENYDYSHFKVFRTEEGRNYVMIHQEDYSAIYHAFIELSDEGEVVKQKFYPNEGGMHISAFPNPFSDTSFYIYQDATSGMYDCEIVEVDTNLNYTKTPIYNFFAGEIYDFGPRGSCKWLNDTTYILATQGQTDDDDRELFLYKMGLDHQFYEEAVTIGQPIYPDNALRHRSMDWKTPDKIYLASWYWPDMNFVLPYYIAVVNQDFEVLGAKIVGGEEKNILINSLIATDDGGCILVGGQRDTSLGDEWAWDGYVAFYSADDLITAASETPNPYDSDYLLLPNPGRDNLTIQSAREGVRLRMFNQVGDLVLERRLTDDFRNEINTSSLRPGVYLCQLLDKNGNREVKKWVKR